MCACPLDYYRINEEPNIQRLQDEICRRVKHTNEYGGELILHHEVLMHVYKTKIIIF